MKNFKSLSLFSIFIFIFVGFQAYASEPTPVEPDETDASVVREFLCKCKNNSSGKVSVMHLNSLVCPVGTTKVGECTQFENGDTEK